MHDERTSIQWPVACSIITRAHRSFFSHFSFNIHIFFSFESSYNSFIIICELGCCCVVLVSFERSTFNPVVDIKENLSFRFQFLSRLKVMLWLSSKINHIAQQQIESYKYIFFLCFFSFLFLRSEAKIFSWTVPFFLIKTLISNRMRQMKKKLRERKKSQASSIDGMWLAA